jgi:hypothetical protein
MLVHDVLEGVGVESILGSVKFSPRQGSKLDHVCLGIVRGRVYTRVEGVLLTPRHVGTYMFLELLWVECILGSVKFSPR